MLSNSDLKSFLNNLILKLDNNTITSEEYNIVLQLFTKINFLNNNTPINNNDIWDYMTMGIYLYEILNNNTNSINIST